MGSDLAIFDLVGYRQISLAIDTGPTGDGRDTVGGAIRLTPTDPLRRIRRTLDNRLDLMELFAGAGYDVQMTTGETTVYMLIGSPPPV